MIKGKADALRYSKHAALPAKFASLPKSIFNRILIFGFLSDEVKSQ
jgi:hypothetical protein